MNNEVTKIIEDMQQTLRENETARASAYYKARQKAKFASLDDKERALRYEIGILIAKKASANQIEQKKKQHKEIELARDKELSSLYTPKPVCKKCQNTGYTRNQLCICVTEKLRNIRLEKSGIEDSLSKNLNAPSKHLNVPKNLTQNEETIQRLEKIYTALNNYQKNFPLNSKNIVLYGGVGSGKTYAAQALGLQLINRGFDVYYTTAFSLVKMFTDFVRSFNDTSILARLFECDFLIIDDLGTEPIIKNITLEYLYNLINERLMRAKPFLITTNLDARALLDIYDERITSRILAPKTSAVIEMSGTDLRLNNTY